MPDYEVCRNWIEKWPHGNVDRCGKPALYIVWGRLFDPEMLGPRCATCVIDQLVAAKYSTYSALDKDKGYAIYHIPGCALPTVAEAYGHDSPGT